jgi:hypothetical protein
MYIIKKLSVYHFIKHMILKLKHLDVESVLVYKLDFPNKTTSNQSPLIDYKLVTDLSQEMLFGNSKKNPKKSLFYLKILINSENSTQNSCRIFEKIDNLKYQSLEKEEEELLNFAVIQKTNTYKKYEYQKYMFNPECPEEDDIDFTQLSEEQVKRKKLSVEKASDSSKEKSKNKNHCSILDDLTVEEKKDLLLHQSKIKAIDCKYQLVFLKYYDEATEQFITLGDMLVAKD